MNVLIDSPFGSAKARTLLFWSVLLGFVSAVILARSPGVLEEAIFGLGLYFLGFFLVLFLGRHNRPGLIEWLIDGRKSLKSLTLFSLMAFPLLAISLAGLYAIYLPLSYWAPELVQELMIDDSGVLLREGDQFPLLPNAIETLTAVIAAPIVEEIVFRGYLLHRWSQKWSVKPAIFVSSLLFALLHVDPIGSFVFGWVLCLLYLYTKSILVPIVIHIMNNLVGTVWSIVDELTSEDPYTLADFQSEWKVAIVALILGAACLLWFLRRYPLTEEIKARLPQGSDSQNAEESGLD